MKQTKYITSGGLAFSENRDMEKLRRYSKKGWHVRDFAFMGYKLEKGEEADYIYNIDYQTVASDEEGEYFDFFSDAGWSHVASNGNIHLFRALPDQKPIYTDDETTIEKYSNSTRTITPISLGVILLTALLWIVSAFTSGGLQSVLNVLAIVLTIIAVPAALTLIGVHYHRWKAEGRRGLNHAIKILLALLVLLVLATHVFFNSPGESLRFILTITLAGIAGPIALWAVMSIYHNRKN